MVSTLKKHGRIWALLVAFSMMLAMLPVVPASAATTYNVTFDTQGGAPVPAVQVVYGGAYAATPTENPTKVGSKFNGWFDAAMGGNAFDFTGTPITVDTTVYAQWVVAITYEVKFMVDGSVVKTVYAPAGSLLEAAQFPTNPTKAGYKFVNWMDGATAYNRNAPVNDDLTLTAKFVRKTTPSGGGGGGGGTTTEPKDDSKKDGTDQGDNAPSTDTPTVALKDIQSHWAEKYINEAVAKGFISGYPDGTFAPNRNITRAEIVTLLVRAFEVPAGNGEHVFADALNHWAKEAISRAAAANIVSGYNEDRFAPDQFITREQLVAMVVRAAKLNNAVSPKTFTDQLQISDWALKAVQIASATNTNIIAGYPDGSFRPQATATRAEAVIIILKALQL